MALSDSKRKANDKYLKANYEHITLSVPKGTRADWKALASVRGLSLCEFIRLAVLYYSERIDKND